MGLFFHASEIKCIVCGSKYVANMKFLLCEEHNYKRLHNGKSKKQVAVERYVQRIPQRQIDQDHKESNGCGLHKPKNRIGGASAKNKYRCGNGQMVTQAEIIANYRITQERILNTRIAVCQGTGRTDLPLSFSHTISRARCKKIGKTELIWDENNIEVESMGSSDSAHEIWEHGDLQSKTSLINFKRKLDYIELHDQETYKKILWELNRINS